MKNIVFVNPGHFGSVTDTYFYCLHLKDRYNITYIGIHESDYSYPIIDGINLVHLDIKKKGIYRKIKFVKQVYRYIRDNDFDLIFINYFVFCSLLCFLKNENKIVDIRSGKISTNKVSVKIFNSLLKLEVGFFPLVTCISGSLKEFLRLPISTHILPLGGPDFPLIKKDFMDLRILYVGTLVQRNIHRTIYAFSNFLKTVSNKSDTVYTIIGYGSELDIKLILDAISEEGLESNVYFLGSIRYPELYNYFSSHNVGMSYIPITEHFNFQPPTKTFEYLLSGMCVLATGTVENRKVISNENGIVVGDTEIELFNGLKELYNSRLKYSSLLIQSQTHMFRWSEIVKYNLHEYFQSKIK